MLRLASGANDSEVARCRAAQVSRSLSPKSQPPAPRSRVQKIVGGTPNGLQLITYMSTRMHVRERFFAKVDPMSHSPKSNVTTNKHMHKGKAAITVLSRDCGQSPNAIKPLIT